MIAAFPYRTREQLLHVLAEAAELEHTALSLYLYAAFSLKRTTDEGITEPELAAVTRWRKALFDIARDEMAHLVTVNNLIVAIGGAPHFNRPNFPVAPGYFPGAFKMELAPFGRESLEMFIALERSMHEAAPEGPRETEHRGAPADFLFPAAMDYDSIGAFYEGLKVALSQASAQLGEKTLFIGAGGQMTAENARLPNSVAVTDLASALAGIEAIVKEGEGSRGEDSECHYGKFTGVRDEYESLLAANPKFAPSRDVVRNPVMRKPPTGDESARTHISAAESVVVLDAANAVYGHLLRLLTQAYRTDGDLGMQGMCMTASLALMHIFADLSSHLTTLPAEDGGSSRAGVTYTMLRSMEPLTQGPAESALIAERLLELSARCETLLPAAVFGKAAARLKETAAAFL